MDELAKALYFPLVVGVCVGIAVYLFQLWRKRQAIVTALELEIDQILTDARENLAYMRDTPHYWLNSGSRIEQAPTALPPPTVAFDALVGEIYVIGKKNVKRVLTFYAHHRHCEGLRTSLFANIARLRDEKKELTESDTSVLSVRLERLCTAYAILERGNPQPGCVKLERVRDSYEIPDAEAVNREIERSAAVASSAAAPATSGASAIGNPPIERQE